MTTVLVTGASGFIGQRIVQRFTREGKYSVIASGRKNAEAQPAGYQFRSADLAQKVDCQRLVAGVDVIVHCAGKAGAWGPRAEFERANVESTRNLLEACRGSSVRRFVNISSPSIYFAYKHQRGLKEGDLPSTFSNAYAETKFRAEETVHASHSPSLSTVSLRPRGVIGAGDRNWLPRIIAMRQAGTLVQPGDATNEVDFTSVENLIDAIELCVGAPAEACGRAYNITNGNPERLWGFIERVLARVGLDGQRKHVPVAVAMTLARLSEFFHSLASSSREPNLLPIKVGVAAYSMTLDISDARNILGYVPRVSTDEAIEEFAEWWKSA